MGSLFEEEAMEFSEKYDKALSSVLEKMRGGEIHKLAGQTPPSLYLGPHFPDGIPPNITRVLYKYQSDHSSHFVQHDWSSWACSGPEGWPTLTEEWKAWVPRMEFFYADVWRRLGIYDAIKLTEQDIVIEKPILAAALCFWSSATNTMNLPLGPMSPTIMDMCTIFGLRPIGVEISTNHNLSTAFRDSLQAPKFKDKDAQVQVTNKSKRSRNYSSLYKHYALLDREPVKENEHAAFLYYWLCKYVFCCKARQCPLDFAILAEALASGIQLALGPFVLAYLYRCLHKIVTNDMDPNTGGPLWMFQLWLLAYFPQMSTTAPEFDYKMSYGRHLMATASSHMSVEKCFTMFYTLKHFKNFHVCYTKWKVAFFANNEESDQYLSDDEWKGTWGSFLISRDLHYGLTLSRYSKPGVEVYLPNYFARQFGFLQSCPVLLNNSLNHLCSWRQKLRTQGMCNSVSRHYQERLSRFKMEPYQTSCTATPLFVNWWSEYSKKFVDPDLKELFTQQIVQGVGDILKSQDGRKRKRTTTDGRKETPALAQQSSSFSEEYSPVGSDNNSGHTIELTIDDEQAETFADGEDNTLIDESVHSFPDDHEAYMEVQHTSEALSVERETTSIQQNTFNQATSSTPLLSAEALAFLDELAMPKKMTPKQIGNDREKTVAEFVTAYCRKPLLTVVDNNLYDRFKQEIKFLISVNHFSPDRMQQIEDHLKVTDVSVIAYTHALEKWDTGRAQEKKYGPIVERQSSRAAKLTQLHDEFNKDAQELAELESRVNVIRERMAAASNIINQEYKEHHEELKLFSIHGRDTQAFLEIKHDLDEAMKKYDSDWAAWERILP